jgi:Zinc carboxypeptidase
MRIFLMTFFLTVYQLVLGQVLHSAFKQNQTLTYTELVEAYKKLDAFSEQAKLEEYCCADNGLPIHVLVINKDKNFNPVASGDTNKLVLLVMNGIHPGESEGIDASLLLAQQMVYGKISIPERVTICIILVYNVEGMLNRKMFTRTNQNGPDEKGFRGNGQNLDLNRDFTKADTKNTLAFYEIFHRWQPDVFLDNHTSNGADYQYTMTLIATQQQNWVAALRNIFMGKCCLGYMLIWLSANGKWHLI